MRRKNIGRTFITIIIIVLLAYAIIDSINKSIWQYEKQESDLESKIEQEKEKTEEELSIGN
jgi:cell division protein FtsL